VLIERAHLLARTRRGVREWKEGSQGIPLPKMADLVDGAEGEEWLQVDIDFRVVLI
jgi:hypothetical protein